VSPGFRKTERYIEFQDVIIEWVGDVAKAINGAPPWSKKWQTKQWLDDPIKNIQHTTPSSFNPPTLE